MNNTVLYRDVPNGRCFRLAEKENICSRLVFDDGVFIKIGNSHAVRVQSGLKCKTIIPGLKVKCTLLPGRILLPISILQGE